MSYRIEFSNEAQKIVKKWKKSNPNSFKKLYRLLPELEQHPRTGTGHPEPLVSGGGITYSRRLSGRDRIIYDVYDETITVLVLEVEGHYGDK
ncbi:MAG: Txe/YoeB family addiction module toxin [Prevotella sp.]|nr:Txe/YoeB family addiction module toxin [Prevotella sp.]MBR6016006.1 Txe/YoeB family addiction module toxin [Prevotella sp.]